MSSVDIKPNFRSIKVTYDNKQVGIVSDAVINGTDTAERKNIIWNLETFTKIITETLNTLNSIINVDGSTSSFAQIDEDVSFIGRYGYSIISNTSRTTSSPNTYIKVEFSYDVHWGTIAVEILW